MLSRYFIDKTIYFFARVPLTLSSIGYFWTIYMIQLGLRNKISFIETGSNKNYSILLTERYKRIKIVRMVQLFKIIRKISIAQIIATILFSICEMRHVRSWFCMITFLAFINHSKLDREIAKSAKPIYVRKGERKMTRSFSKILFTPAQNEKVATSEIRIRWYSRYSQSGLFVACKYNGARCRLQIAYLSFFHYRNLIRGFRIFRKISLS